SQLVWDWSTGSSNYASLRAAQEASLQHAAWELESSIDLSQQIITNTILAGGQYDQYGASAPTSDATQDYLPIGNFSDAGACEDGDAGGAVKGACETAEQVRSDDIAALFAGMSSSVIRVTRIRSDIAQSAMTVDLVL